MRGAGTPGREAGPTSKAEFVREVTQRSLDELSQQLEAGNSQQLDAYLRAMGQFHRYSFNNVMLIVSQRPGATQVAGFHTWRKLGRAVKKGEKGIAIFAPMKIKPRARDDTASEEDKESLRAHQARPRSPVHLRRSGVPFDLCRWRAFGAQSCPVASRKATHPAPEPMPPLRSLCRCQSSQ